MSIPLFKLWNNTVATLAATFGPTGKPEYDRETVAWFHDSAVGFEEFAAAVSALDSTGSMQFWTEDFGGEKPFGIITLQHTISNEGGSSTIYAIWKPY